MSSKRWYIIAGILLLAVAVPTVLTLVGVDILGEAFEVLFRALN